MGGFLGLGHFEHETGFQTKDQRMEWNMAGKGFDYIYIGFLLKMKQVPNQRS